MHLANWDTHPIHLPYSRHIQWASSEEDGADYLLLRLVADDGTVGVAEALTKTSWQGLTPGALAAALEERVIPLLSQMDLLDENAVNGVLDQLADQRQARAMVETAC